LRQDYSPNTWIFPPVVDPNAGNPGGTLFDPTVVSQVKLPNNQSYFFKYNPHAELAQVTLPTGGVFQYDWGPGPDTPAGTDGMDGEWGVPPLWPEVDPSYTGQMFVYRRINERRVYPDGSALESITRYSATHDQSAFLSTVTVDLLDIGQNLQTRTKHYFFGDPIFSPPQGTSYAHWLFGREYQTEAYDAGGNLLRRVVATWQQRAPVSWIPSWLSAEPANDPRIIETVTTLVDANLVSKQTFGYDQYNNPTDVYEYDFGIGAPGPLIRRTHTPYLTTNGNQGNVNYATDNNIHIRNLPIQKLVYDASGNLRSHTDFFYDNYGTFPIVARPGIVQHDSGFHAGYGARGNLTGVILRNPGGSPSEIHLHYQYDVAGNPVKAVDGRGIATDFEFSDRFGSADDDARSNAGAPELAGGFTYAFPTKITNALGHTAYTQYDYYLGRPVNTEDANEFVSSVTYNDVLDRPTQGIQARYKVGVGVPSARMQTTFTYDETNHMVTTTSDRDTFNDNVFTAKAFYNGLGRTRRSAAYEDSTWTITDTQFDALGRVSQVSNPYRASDPGSASPPSGLWTTTEYDALSRVIRVTTPDGAHVDTAYSGNNTLVIDQAGKKRISRTDALGRLTNVWEVRSPDAASGTVPVSFSNHPEVTAGYQTDYFYDPLDNLRAVSQGAQGRWFSYDSLSRLIRVRTLEQNCNPNLPPHTDRLLAATAGQRHIPTTPTATSLKGSTSVESPPTTITTR
jgi:hypothetical protein